MTPPDSNVFDDRIERALRTAESAHRGQMRKGADSTPYVLHPIHCAIALARCGYASHVIQAAILHDVVEDCPGWNRARVEAEFGATVAAIVAELTEDKSKTWDERKRLQVEHVSTMSADALAVKAADKLHNLRTLGDDLAASPDRSRVWAMFKGGRERTLAQSRALVDALAPRVDPRLGSALTEAMTRIERIESG